MARGLRGFADGLVSVLLAGYLTRIGFSPFQVGAIVSGTPLPSNGEWQAAAIGTPDAGFQDNNTTDCNTLSLTGILLTGSRSDCMSLRGAFDMVGSVYEMVADWVPRSTGCTTWGPYVGESDDDFQCLSGAATDGEPAALWRGGAHGSGDHAGLLDVFATLPLSYADHPDTEGIPTVGFRCAR